MPTRRGAGALSSGAQSGGPLIAVFGGTFDPVHFGHLRAALEAQEKLGPKEFRVMPAGSPPHRDSTFAGAEHRLAMMKLALARHPELQLDSREVERGGASYMVDTLDGIHADHPGATILLLIGEDAANAMDRWHRWRRLFELSHLVILRRPESELDYSGELGAFLASRTVSSPDDLRRASAGLVLPLEVTQLAISSTDIRRRISRGLSPGYLLPESVIEYIAENGLYGYQSSQTLRAPPGKAKI